MVKHFFFKLMRNIKNRFEIYFTSPVKNCIHLSIEVAMGIQRQDMHQESKALLTIQTEDMRGTEEYQKTPRFEGLYAG